MPPRLNTCQPWAVLEDLPEDCADVDPVDGERVLQMATDILFEFTGRRWPGVCDDVVRPYTCGCDGPTSCGCEPAGQISLPRRPVVEVSQVRIDGEVVNPDLYRVDADRWLVFLSDEAEGDDPRGWPTSQRLQREATEDQTFEVVYEFGTLPPAGAELVTATLACELLKAFSPEPGIASGCRLPRRVTSITRQGVTMAILDPLTLFAEQRTGLAEVDLWIEAKNNIRKNRQGSVTIPRPSRSRDWRFRRTS